MTTRPVIKISLSPLDKKLEKTAVVFLLLLWSLTIFAYIYAPATIPVHFNASGKIDSYGSKLTLWLLPAIATSIYAGITCINKYPHNLNYMVSITKENALQQYTDATRMLRFLKISVLFIFTLIVFLSLLTVMGYIQGIGRWFLPVVLLLILLPTIYYIARALKSR